VERIRRSVRSLLGLVSDLLDLAAAESHDLRVEQRPTDVAALTHELAEEHRAAAQAAGLHLSAGGDDGIGAVVTDPARVRQVVGNLLSNAVKYTPAGGHVSLWVRQSPDNGRHRVLRITVSDTGPGIPPDARDRIFDEFIRLHDSTTPGAGLGLAISRHIARALGGDVRLAPPSGTGATFVFELPLERRAARRGDRRHDG
jgi:signal transduction histidine kinase